jgi:hypothetical protein
LDHLFLALALAVRVEGLPLEGSPRLRAILDEVGRASTVETTIVVVSLVDWQKARSRTLLLLLLRLGCWWSIKSSLLGWSSYPCARQVTSTRCSGTSVLNQLIPWRLCIWRPCGCLPFLFCSVGWDAVFLSDDHVDQLIEIIGPYQIQSFFKFGVQASAKTISFAGIIVHMVSRILAQVVKDLCILQNGASSLSQI